VERQVAERISFQRVLRFPERPQDYSTMWRFRERLAETGRDRLVWMELKRQLDEKGPTVKKGVVHDASFIIADPGTHPLIRPVGRRRVPG
jgi:IS5 family transposase